MANSTNIGFGDSLVQLFIINYSLFTIHWGVTTPIFG